MHTHGTPRHRTDKSPHRATTRETRSAPAEEELRTPGTPSATTLLALQRTVGNAAVADMVGRSGDAAPRSRPAVVQRATDDGPSDTARGKRKSTATETGARPSKRQQGSDAPVDRITELVEACTCKPQTKQAGRMTSDVTLRHERSFRGGEEAAQTLRHISTRLLRVINYLEDAERERAFGSGEGTPQEAANAKTEAEVQTMLINGRLVVATNYDQSISLLMRHFPAEELGAGSDAMDVDSGSPPPHAGDWVQDLLLDEGQRPPVRGVDETRRKRAKAKLHEVYEGKRTNATGEALREVRRTEEVDGAPTSPKGVERLFNALTSDDYRNCFILLRGPGANAAKTMHAEQKHLLALKNSGADRKKAGQVRIRGQRRPCRSCWALLDHFKQDFDLDVHGRPGAYYKESTETIAERLPEGLTELDEQDEYPLATKLAGPERMNVSAKKNSAGDAASASFPQGAETLLHPVKVEQQDEAAEPEYVLNDPRIDIGYDTASDSEAEETGHAYVPRVRPLPAIEENISKNKAKGRGPAPGTKRESAAKGTTKFELTQDHKDDLKLAKEQGAGRERDPRSRGGHKAEIHPDQWPIIDRILSEAAPGSGAQAALVRELGVSSAAISKGRKTYRDRQNQGS